jgi:2-polyprenyl-3-methyl-5-hydroxy-6-metoxy-1,4-benzoquinol methylase
MRDNPKPSHARKHLTLAELYTSTPEGDQFEEELEQSLHPRGPDLLLDMVEALNLGPNSKIIDVGCGTGYYACKLVEQTGAQVLAIDIVASLLEMPRHQIAEANLRDRVAVVEGSITSIPADSETYDLVWCRDMLNHIKDLAVALAECYRVLRTGGSMIVFQTFAGELIEPHEAARLYQALAIIPENMSTAYVEQSFTTAGFTIRQKDIIASEWREREVEVGDQTALQSLLHAARLLRKQDDFIQKYGEGRYEQALGDAQWYPFIMLGKLLSVAYLLRK